MDDLSKIRRLGPDDPLESAVYCAHCKHFKQHVIGEKCGLCFGHKIDDGTVPMVCPYFRNHLQIVSVLVFLQSGISVYHRAIVPNAAKQFDPHMLSSFLQAINMFGEELTKEEVSQIQFQKMNIFVCRYNKAYGAMLVKGEVDDGMKKVFTNFLKRIEEGYPEYFKQEYSGACLPLKDIDQLGIACIKEYMDDYIPEPFHTIPTQVLEKESKLKVAPESLKEPLND